MKSIYLVLAIMLVLPLMMSACDGDGALPYGERDDDGYTMPDDGFTPPVQPPDDDTPPPPPPPSVPGDGGLTPPAPPIM